MTPYEYQQKALRTETTPDFINPAYVESLVARSADGGLDARQLGRLIHGLLGQCTEVGEAQDGVKKSLVYGRPFDKVNAKLLKRFPQKFSPEQALNRDLDAERAVLENA